MQLYGDFEDISVGDEQVFAFVRTLGNKRALVVLNFVDKEVEFKLPSGRDWSGYKLGLGNYRLSDGAGEGLRSAELQGYEGKVYVEH
jgi:oligo-1,6-glucosidase